METVRHDPQPPLIGDRDIPVRQSRPHRMRDRGNSRRYADPQPIAGIARDEVHLDDRLALDLIIQRARLAIRRSEEHTSELQSLMRISYAVFCLKKKTYNKQLKKS